MEIRKAIKGTFKYLKIWGIGVAFGVMIGSETDTNRQHDLEVGQSSQSIMIGE